MERFSAVFGQLQNCRNLVEEVSVLMKSVEVVKGKAKLKIEALLQQVAEELNVTGVFVRACHTQEIAVTSTPNNKPGCYRGSSLHSE
jgi:hypothetical protein